MTYTPPETAVVTVVIASGPLDGTEIPCKTDADFRKVCEDLDDCPVPQSYDVVVF